MVTTHLSATASPAGTSPRARRAAPPLVRHLRATMVLSVVALLGMVSASLMGLLVDGLYGQPTSTAAMLRGYDLVTLFAAVPLLVASAIGVLRGSRKALLVWLGVLAYDVYNYAIYLFATEFNDAFLLHVVTFTTSAVALGLGLATMDVERMRSSYRPRTPVRAVSVLLGLLGVGLGAMWVVVSLQNAFTGDIPAGSSLVETPRLVHLGIVLDLVLLVPAYLVAAVLLWRREAWGYVMAGVLLVSGLLHQIGYMVAMPMQASADVPGAVSFDPLEPVIAALFLVGAVLMVGDLRTTRR